MARLVGRQVGNAGPDPARLGLGGDEGGVAVPVGQGVGGRGFRLGGGFTLRGGGRLGPLRRSRRARERGWSERGGRGGWSSAPSPSPHRRRARAFNSPASPPSPQPGRWLWPPTWRGRPLRRWGLWPDDEGGRGGGRRVRGGGERVDRPACAAGRVSVSLSLSLCLSHRRAVQTRGGQGNGGCVGGSGGWVGHLERERMGERVWDPEIAALLFSVAFSPAPKRKSTRCSRSSTRRPGCVCVCVCVCVSVCVCVHLCVRAPSRLAWRASVMPPVLRAGAWVPRAPALSHLCHRIATRATPSLSLPTPGRLRPAPPHAARRGRMHPTADLPGGPVMDGGECLRT